jgi:hypothetical protein
MAAWSLDNMAAWSLDNMVLYREISKYGGSREAREWQIPARSCKSTQHEKDQH